MYNKLNFLLLKCIRHFIKLSALLLIYVVLILQKFTNSIKPKYGNHHKHLMNRKETDLLETTLTDDKL